MPFHNLTPGLIWLELTDGRSQHLIEKRCTGFEWKLGFNSTEQHVINCAALFFHKQENVRNQNLLNFEQKFYL